MVAADADGDMRRNMRPQAGHALFGFVEVIGNRRNLDGRDVGQSRNAAMQHIAEFKMGGGGVVVHANGDGAMLTDSLVMRENLIFCEFLVGNRSQ